MTAVSFNNMSEYMRNFDLTKRVEHLEVKEKERNALLKLIQNHYDDTTKFIDRKYLGVGDPDKSVEWANKRPESDEPDKDQLEQLLQSKNLMYQAQLIVGQQELKEEEFNVGDALAQMEKLYQESSVKVKVTYHELLERDEEDKSQEGLPERPFNAVNAEKYLFNDFKLLASPVLRADRRKICDLIDNFVSLA